MSSRGTLRPTTTLAATLLGIAFVLLSFPGGADAAGNLWPGFFVVGPSHPLHSEAAQARPLLNHPIVVWVDPQSPVSRAGLRAGDYILGTVSREVNSADQLESILAAAPQPLKVQNANGLRVVGCQPAPVTAPVQAFFSLRDLVGQPSSAARLAQTRGLLAQYGNYPLVSFFGAVVLAKGKDREAARQALTRAAEHAPDTVLARMCERRLRLEAGATARTDAGSGSAQAGSGSASGSGPGSGSTAASGSAADADPALAAVAVAAGSGAGSGSGSGSENPDDQKIPLPMEVKAFKALPLAKRIEILRQLHEQHPRNQAIPRQLARHLVEDADLKRAQKAQVEDLERILGEARDLSPEEPLVFELWGIVLLDARRPDAAAPMLEKAAELKPGEPSIRHNLIIALFGCSRFDDAVTHAEALVRMMPDDFFGHFFLGRCKFELQDFDAAVDSLEQAVKLAKNDNDRNAADRFLQQAKERLAKAGGKSSTDENQRFIVRYAGNSQQDIGEVTMDVLEAAYDQVTDDLRLKPDVKIQVIFFFTDDFYSVNQAQQWVGAFASGINIMAPLKAGYANPENVRETLAHEFTHVIINLRTNRNCPSWVHEGLATYEGFKAAYGDGGTLRSDYQRLFEKIQGNDQPLPRIHQINLNTSVSDDGTIGLQYLTANLVMRHIINKHGWQAVDELLTSLGKGAHIDNAIEEATGRDMGTLQKEFDNWVKTL